MIEYGNGFGIMEGWNGGIMGFNINESKNHNSKF